MRRDLARFRELDDRLLKSLEPKTPTVERESPPPGPSPPRALPAGCAAPDLLSDDMRREQQRLKWEEEEQSLRDKADIHYQDVLFEGKWQQSVQIVIVVCVPVVFFKWGIKIESLDFIF